MKHETLQWVGRAGKAKNRSSASPKDRLSGLRLTAGREAIAERLPSDEGTPRLEAPHLGWLCGGPMFLAKAFCYFSAEK